MNSEKPSRGVSRRQFLAGSAIAAGSLAALTGCAPRVDTADSATSSDAGKSDADMIVDVRKHAAKLNPQNIGHVPGESDMPTLFSEWKFGSLTFPHRIVKSAAGVPGMYEKGLAGEEPLSYYSGLVKGGVRMIWMDDAAEMYTHFKAIPDVGKLAEWTEDELKQIVDTVHAEGAFIGYQLMTMGILFSGSESSGKMFVSSSCTDMTPEEISLFREDLIEATARLQKVGFDAIEINAAGDNVVQTFMSRNRNKREDEYGSQDMENRTRFVVELITGIKKACGEDFPVQVLINGVEENDETIGDNSLYTTVEESKVISKILEEAGADSLHVRIGPSGQHVCEFAGDLYFTGYGIEGTTSYGTQFDFKRHWQGKLVADRSGLGLMVDVAAEIKEAVSIPVGVVTYMDPARDAEFFEDALKDEKFDFMLMNRPLNVDAEYVNKFAEGRLDEIAPCCRCLHCHWDADREGDVVMSCRVKASWHRAYRDAMPEGADPLVADAAKRVMVIGAGPAGLEAARIAAQRGHSVTLYDKKDSVGGLLGFAHAVKGEHENLGVLRDYLKRQLDLAGVEIVTGQEVDGAFIEAQAPDAVILAAGGSRVSLGLPEAAGISVVAIDDFMTAEIGDTVIVVGSNAQAIDTTMYLMAQGKQVSIVTPSPLAALGDGHSHWVRTFVNPMIKALGCRIWPEAEIVALGDAQATIKTSADVEVRVPCDTVIEAMDMLANTGLIEDLGIEAYAVGDCENPYNIANAIATGNLAARKL